MFDSFEQNLTQTARLRPYNLPSVEIMMVRIGVALIAASFACWALVPFVPVVGLRGAKAAGAIAVLAIAAEVAFWLGLVLAGRDTWRLAKQHGWRGAPRALWQTLREGRVPAPESVQRTAA